MHPELGSPAARGAPLSAAPARPRGTHLHAASQSHGPASESHGPAPRTGSVPASGRRARNRPLLFSLEALQSTTKRWSQRPGRPWVRYGSTATENPRLTRPRLAGAGQLLITAARSARPGTSASAGPDCRTCAVRLRTPSAASGSVRTRDSPRRGARRGGRGRRRVASGLRAWRLVGYPFCEPSAPLRYGTETLLPRLSPCPTPSAVGSRGGGALLTVPRTLAAGFSETSGTTLAGLGPPDGWQRRPGTEAHQTQGRGAWQLPPSDSGSLWNAARNLPAQEAASRVVPLRGRKCAPRFRPLTSQQHGGILAGDVSRILLPKPGAGSPELELRAGRTSGLRHVLFRGALWPLGKRGGPTSDPVGLNVLGAVWTDCRRCAAARKLGVRADPRGGGCLGGDSCLLARLPPRDLARSVSLGSPSSTSDLLTKFLRYLNDDNLFWNLLWQLTVCSTVS